MNRLVSSNATLHQKLSALSSERCNVLQRSSEKPIITLDHAVDIILRYGESERSRRIVVGIGGFPASGKTTGAKWLVRKINGLSHAKLAAHLPMDGFHFPNRRLVADSLESIKGDVITFDVDAYVDKLATYKHSSRSSLVAPDYVREKHDVFEDLIEISEEVCILITEGIYVGYPEGKWSKIRDLLDILFYLDTPPEQCADRIVSRNLDVGRSERMIEQKLKNDFCFMKRSIQVLECADYIVRV